METKKIKLRDIKQYENNAKIHTYEQIEQIKKSINDYGYIFPIVVDSNNVIIAGHGRYEALKELEYDEIDCIIVDNLSDEKVKQLRLLDNKIADNTGYDIKLLNEELATLVDFDFDFYNFDFDDFSNIDLSTIEPNLSTTTTENEVVSTSEKKTVVCPFCDCAFEIKD